MLGADQVSLSGRADLRRIPGNKLPGYFQASLWDVPILSGKLTSPCRRARLLPWPLPIEIKPCLSLFFIYMRHKLLQKIMILTSITMIAVAIVAGIAKYRNGELKFPLESFNKWGGASNYRFLK